MLKGLIQEIANFEEIIDIDNQYIQAQYAQKLRLFYRLFDSLDQSSAPKTIKIEEKLVNGNNTLQIFFKDPQDKTIIEEQEQLNESAIMTESIVKIEQQCEIQRKSNDFNMGLCVKNSLKHFKFRHPQFLDHVQLYNFEKLDVYLKERGIHVKNIIYILKDVVRNLYIYRAYFIEKRAQFQKMENFQQLQLKVIEEIQYLQKVFQFQQNNIRQLFPAERKEIISQLISLKQYPNLLKIYMNEQTEGKNTVKQEDIDQDQGEGNDSLEFNGPMKDKGESQHDL